MTRLLCFTMVCALAVTPASADEYWVSYEGNDFPENEGWIRVFSAGGAIRTIEHGALVLDSRLSAQIVDFYSIERPVDPEPGETFLMRWRMRIDDIPVGFPFDPTVVVFSDQFTAVGFEIAEDRIQSTFEPGLMGTFSPGLFHLFEFWSDDMASYDLYVDGQLLFGGSFYSVFNQSRVSWGDGIQGGRSLAVWDRFEFGVVPEPSTLLSVACASLAMFGRRRTINIIKE